jgi:hypothetical protein
MSMDSIQSLESEDDLAELAVAWKGRWVVEQLALGQRHD